MTLAVARADVASSARRARERAELWRMGFEALYGPPSGDLASLGPGELPDAEQLGRLTRPQLVARPRALRRLLGPLVVTGHAASWERDPEIHNVVIAAMRDTDPRPRNYDDALERLREHARERLGITPDAPVRRELHALARLLAPESMLVIEPALVTQRQGVATISRRARFRMPFAELAPRLDPDTWLEMGPFFEKVGAVAGEVRRRDDGWDGLFEELFVVDWGMLRLQSFNTFLKIDYTLDRERARTDYSLVYEVDDQLEHDSGFIEARRIPGQLGWCEYYTEKTLRFRSPQSNIFAPMLMSAFLESGVSAIEDATVERHLAATSQKGAVDG